MKRGEVVEAKPARPVTVYSLSLQKFQPPFFTLDVECGGGFYIRSLVSDIGKAELALKKSKPEESNEQVLSCEYITLNETKREDDVIKSC
ncbi:TruB pseudouridine synthase family member 1 [Rhinolophus ferrumequinum]|uniref:TruB pseudouridine synthase family member 1 n=1 Tax=Rhinolophus ferrumequinum TaxID=59479 RepID=A0A7J7UYX9_RHIFE|nr:TruB pseudouridine synthase family member 1 [Rhinolophus ferrumequinum]